MKVSCPQCGGEVQVQEASGFIGCPFCRASLVLDLTGVRLHLLYRPRQGGASVLPLLRRWGDAQGLPSPSLASAPHLVYRPFWRFTVQGRPRLVPAWSTLEARWMDLSVPEAEQTIFDPAAVGSAQVLEGSVAEAAARARASDPGAAAPNPGELVHIPFYEVSVRLGGYEARVSLEACSGQVYPERMPPGVRDRARQPFGTWTAVLGFLVMFLEAVLVPSGWVAAIAVALTALALSWAIMSDAGSRSG